RSLLMRFLDRVDMRDGAGAASLFHPDGVWAPGPSTGEIRGAEAIAAFIAAGLPPREYGHRFHRHRMLSAADPDDLRVVTPTGVHCRFEMEVGASDKARGARPAIRVLTRHLL
ncbi:MAG: nuclear transport factor 2 family protein, partial [Phenylobacterium sp.]|nr:nuclear transport factor 2 family protein [Phenylobacterium sp.]